MKTLYDDSGKREYISDPGPDPRQPTDRVQRSLDDYARDFETIPRQLEEGGEIARLIRVASQLMKEATKAAMRVEIIAERVVLGHNIDPAAAPDGSRLADDDMGISEIQRLRATIEAQGMAMERLDRAITILDRL